MQVGDFKLSSLPDILKTQIYDKKFLDSILIVLAGGGDTTPVFDDSKNSRSIK